jgi:hypothetical protein
MSGGDRRRTGEQSRGSAEHRNIAKCKSAIRNALIVGCADDPAVTPDTPIRSVLLPRQELGHTLPVLLQLLKKRGYLLLELGYLRLCHELVLKSARDDKRVDCADDGFTDRPRALRHRPEHALLSAGSSRVQAVPRGSP